MRLASVDSGGRDGALVVVSKDGERLTRVRNAFGTLQAALENWTSAEPHLRGLSERLEAATSAGEPREGLRLLAPLPRAWQWLDASAYPSHGELMDKVLGITPQKGRAPLMYQGVSDRFYAPDEDVPIPSEDLGIDFEGEFGVVVDEVPMGVSPEDAASHIKLLVQINDWSLRTLAGPEMKTGFGWVQAKPHCSMAPFAITPDALGEAWQDSRVCLHLAVDWNGQRFGDAFGKPMAFGFHELVAHAARTRRLVAGTVIGSGTVSNDDYRKVGSSCIAERRGIEIVDLGEPKTAFMRFGDRVRMSAHGPDGYEPFGVIDQCVVSSPKPATR